MRKIKMKKGKVTVETTKETVELSINSKQKRSLDKEKQAKGIIKIR